MSHYMEMLHGGQWIRCAPMESVTASIAFAVRAATHGYTYRVKQFVPSKRGVPQADKTLYEAVQ